MNTFAIKIPPLIAKLILWINPFTRRALVMCRGYGDDDTSFTELVWPDDRNLDFFNKADYPEFQLWVRCGSAG